PANITLTRDGTVKILDFGIAGLTEAFTTVTATGDGEPAEQVRIGTPGYMAPEQLAGTGFDERCDVVSLGVVLFEMATGERAYETSDAVALALSMAAPLRRADTVDHRVPRPLADVIARATRIDAAERFPTAAAVGRALAEIENRPFTPVAA